MKGNSIPWPGILVGTLAQTEMSVSSIECFSAMVIGTFSSCYKEEKTKAELQTVSSLGRRLGKKPSR